MIKVSPSRACPSFRRQIPSCALASANCQGCTRKRLTSQGGRSFAQQRLRLARLAFLGQRCSQAHFRGGRIRVAGVEFLLADLEGVTKENFGPGRVTLKLACHRNFDQRCGDVRMLVSTQFAPHYERLARILFRSGKISAIKLQHPEVAENLGDGPVLRSIGLLDDFESLSKIMFGLRVIAPGLQHPRPVGKRSGKQRMLFSESLAANLESLMQHRLRIFPIASCKQNPAQVVQRVAEIRMVGGHDAATDCERLALRRFGFGEIAGVNGRSRQIVKMDEVTSRFSALESAADFDSFPKQLPRLLDKLLCAPKRGQDSLCCYRPGRSSVCARC